MTMRVADNLVGVLQHQGVSWIASLSGNQIMPLYDACILAGMPIIHTRHEAAAVHMADAWGRLTNRPGVALVAAGPGFANALSAMYVALKAESPLLIISGHAPLSPDAGSSFQALSQHEMALPVTKASWLMQRGETIHEVVAKALGECKAGRPGPVHLSIPSDILSATVTSKTQVANQDTPDREAFTNTDTNALVDVLDRSHRPLVLTGPALGRTAAHSQARPALAEAGIPLIAMESPRGVHDPSLGALCEVLAVADVLVLLGKKLDHTLANGTSPTIAPSAQILQIDAEREVLAMTTNAGHERPQRPRTFHANPLTILQQLSSMSMAKSPGRLRWYDEVDRALRSRLLVADTNRISRRGLHPLAVARAANEFLALAQDAIVISDGGEFCQWMQAYVQGPTRLINGPSGAIGMALPFALAARLAHPQSRIVAFTGDGGFGFHAFEFDTAVRHHLPVTLVIGNDARWNAEYQIQMRDYGPERTRYCTLRASAYHKVAEGLGAWSRQIGEDDDLVAALLAADRSGSPACLNVSVSPEPAPRFGL